MVILIKSLSNRRVFVINVVVNLKKNIFKILILVKKCDAA